MDYITAQEAEEQLGINTNKLSYAAILHMIPCIKIPDGEVTFGSYTMQVFIEKYKRDDVIKLIASLKGN